MEASTRDSTVTLALLSAGAYACAFAFDGGYLSHFGVPIQFVEVNLRGLLLSAAALMGSGAIGLGVVAGSLHAAPPSALRHLIIRTLGVTLVMAAIAYAMSTSMLVSLIFALALAAPDWILPAWLYRGERISFNEKIEKFRASERPTILEASLISARQTSPRITGTILLLILAVIVAWILGGWYARRQEEFLIADDCIALRIEDRTLLCARWDGALTGEYQYRAAEDVVLSMERVGPIPRYRHQLLRPAAQQPAGDPPAQPATDVPATDVPATDAASNTQGETPSR